jgi:hypothetical protein
VGIDLALPLLASKRATGIISKSKDLPDFQPETKLPSGFSCICSGYLSLQTLSETARSTTIHHLLSLGHTIVVLKENTISFEPLVPSAKQDRFRRKLELMIHVSRRQSKVLLPLSFSHGSIL